VAPIRMALAASANHAFRFRLTGKALAPTCMSGCAGSSESTRRTSAHADRG
jgi:hypothetical protein